MIIALSVALLLGGLVAFLRVRFTGAPAADALESMLNPEMRGRIEIRSVDWPVDGLTKVVTGGWIPFTLDDVDIFDADGKQILHVEKITLELDIHAFLFGNHDLVFRHVVFDSGWAILEEIPEPYPLHQYDTSIISLFAAFYTPRKPGFYFGVTAESPPVFDIRDFRLENIDLELAMGAEFGEVDGKSVATSHAFVADCQNVSGSGFFYTDPSDPLVPKVYFSMPDGKDPIRAESAEVTVEGDYHFSLTSLELDRFAQLPTDWPRDPVANNLELVLHATSKEGAEIALDAKLLDYWDSPYGGNYLVKATVTKAGGMAHESIDSGMGGDDLTITADVTGPILYPRYHAHLKDLEYSVSLVEDEEPLKLFLDELDVSLDDATNTGSLDQTIGRVRQRGKDGEVSLSAKFGPGEKDSFWADAHLTISHDNPIDLAQWLPPEVTRAFGSELSGSLHSRGSTDYTVQVDGLALQLGTLHLTDGAIYAKDRFELYELEDLHASAGDTKLRLGGSFRSTPETFALDVDVDSGDLDAWLARFGVPAIARTARGKHVIAEGSLDHPTAHGTLALTGVPVLDDFDTTFAYGDDALTIDRGVSTSVGDVRVHGTVDLRGAPRARHVVITGRGVDLGRVGGMKAVVDGRADVDAVASGPLDDRLRVDATVTSDDVTLLGQRASRLRACYNHDPAAPICTAAAALAPDDARQCTYDAAHGGRCLIAGVTRTDGGTATVVARTDRNDHLAGHVGLDALPLDAIARMAGEGTLPAGGTATLDVDLGGTLGAPTAAGTVGLLRTWVFGAFLGDQQFELRVASGDDPAQACAGDRADAPATSTGKLALCGSLGDGRVVVAALVDTAGKMPVVARVDLRRVELDPFVDLGELAGAPWPLRAWTSGTVTIRTELAGAHPPLSVQLELPELAILIPQTDSDGRPAPLVVRNTDDSPLSLDYDGEHVVLRRPVTLQTPAGPLSVSGKLDGAALALAVKGSLQLGELEPLLAPWFDEVDGTIAVDATIGGTLDAPAITAQLDLDQIVLRPAGQDTQLAIAHARIDHSPENGLSFNALQVAVVDPSSGERAQLTVKGGLKLDGFTPARWGVIVDGQLAGKMLLALAPAELTQASGVADLSLVVQGDGAHPTISGDVAFDAKRPIAVMPRGLHREIVLSGGQLSFTEDHVTLDDISGSIDDEGSISHVVGEITLDGGDPVGGEISLDADGIPFRVPRTLDLVLAARDLQVRWGDDVDDDGVPDMELEGNVAIVQGSYTRSLSFGEFLKPTESSSAPTKPFWEEYPMLGNARLALGIEARSLSVANNIANIEMTGHVDLSGTPRTPRLDGQISILRGTFKPQFTRARFTRTRGQVSFSPFSAFPDDTPTLDVTSEADYRDSTGQDHLITLTLQGPLSRLEWDLGTSTGLNKGQTLTMLLIGQTPEENARNAPDVLASDVNQVDPTTDHSTNPADQVIKDLGGDFISLLVADPLKNVGLFDVARLEVGTGSIGFHGERKVYSNANVIGDVEQTVRGRTLNVRVEIKSTFGMALQLGYLGKTYDDPAEEDVQDFESKLVYRMFIP